jgi:hypothetical protein
MPATIRELMDFFGFKTTSEFTPEWKNLTEKDKEQLKEGIGDGTFNY